MNDKTTTTVVVAALVVLAGGLAVTVGATGPVVTETADVAAQETTTQANQTAAGDGTNLTASNVTIERLVLRNVTVTDARFGELTVLNATGGENASNETYSDVALDRVEATGETTDLTLTNVTVRNESLADALLNETGQLEIQTRLIMDLAVLQNRTVNGLAVEQATVSSEVAENVSVSTAGGDQPAGDDGDAATEQGQPALSAETAEVEGVDLTNLSVAGASVGATAETTATETVTDGETTAEGMTETTAVEVDATTGETTAVDGTTTTEVTTTATVTDTGNETTTNGTDES